ncbi:unnamed protein product [Dracunculus medinensis]|uniref:Uncharacterized protein n=1 Tax=Dracunculus medinensis TaxID=318479 RepID=A0A0N4U9J0_DRAME|nr:unnamed protein product [Dracunculus medinensis]
MLYPLEINHGIEPESETTIENSNLKSARKKFEIQEPTAMRTRASTKRMSKVQANNYIIKKTCKKTTDIPLNLPNKWNCEEILQQNLTPAKIIPFLDLALGQQINNVQYSYGWRRVRCQSTVNFALTEGQLLAYDGNGWYPILAVLNTALFKAENVLRTINSLHKKIGVYGAPHNYASHVIISELQTYFNNKTKKKIGIKKKS